ncbi:MAG: hypothetical protein PVI40_07080 [Chlamydiota bacterium]|jgi:hypothetical protein
MSLLGDYNFKKKLFEDIDNVFEEFYTEDFKNLPDRKRSDFVNSSLLQLIQKKQEPCFLLPQVLDFIERVDREDILQHYRFTSFELWLNQYSNLPFEDNLKVRGKIAGKWVPREEYQVFFPIGMGKIYPGTHFVTAHKSPDLDTTIASFWGWMDSFAARVGDGLHMWNLPGGPPESQIEINLIFKEVFGEEIFSHLVKKRTTLTLTGNDLMKQEGLVQKTLKDSISTLPQERQEKSVVLVDEEGFYLGDFRSMDVEGVRQIVLLLNNSLRWFENLLHVNLISIFAQEKVKFEDISKFINDVFNQKIKDAESAYELSENQKESLANFFVKVFGLEKGLETTFEELGKALTKLSVVRFADIRKIMDSIAEANLFDEKGYLQENRPKIFHYIEKIIKELHKTLLKVRTYLEKLEVAFQIKTQVLGYSPKFATVRADVEELRSKIGSYHHLTITYPDQGKFFPVGVVKATDLRKPILGTVSLRDFCNLQEMSIPSYFEVISVIDHHKASLNTLSPSMTIISDAQSSNALVAEQSFIINDRYSTSNMEESAIDKELQNEELPLTVMQRLLQKKSIIKLNTPYFIHPEREMIEYLHFLYGILDDTDLLMKVSSKDVECVASLLNRMKSLLMKKETEIINLSDIPKDKDFAKKSAKRILQNEDMYSLYKKVYQFREEEVEKNIQLCASSQPHNLFKDTKEQNGCCRVGQTKMFANNLPIFQEHENALRKQWIEEAQAIYKKKPEVDLHLHMISTIVSADEVYKDQVGQYSHKDQLWIWIPPTGLAIEHLKRFLNSLQESPQMQNNDLLAEFLGDNAEELTGIFEESFLKIPYDQKDESLPMAVLYYNAGSINSRKAMISPYLPSIIS